MTFFREIRFPATNRDRLQAAINIVEETIKTNLFWPQEFQILEVYNSDGSRSGEMQVNLKIELTEEEVKSLEATLKERTK